MGSIIFAIISRPVGKAKTAMLGVVRGASDAPTSPVGGRFGVFWGSDAAEGKRKPTG